MIGIQKPSLKELMAAGRKKLNANEKTTNKDTKYLIVTMDKWSQIDRDKVTGGNIAVGTDGCSPCLGLIWITPLTVMTLHISPPDSNLHGWADVDLLKNYINSVVECIANPNVDTHPEKVYGFSYNELTKETAKSALRGLGIPNFEVFLSQGKYVHGENLECVDAKDEAIYGRNDENLPVWGIPGKEK
ncbi:MAG: hypothetical protein ON057_001263 [Glomeribacter sp. 1016415]|nr:hypothetical protein [Glomeribacter sp. 1016415]